MGKDNWSPINIDEWISNIQKLLIKNNDFNLDELLFQRIFYYLNWIKNGNNTVDSNDISKFIGDCWYLGKYRDVQLFFATTL